MKKGLTLLVCIFVIYSSVMIGVVAKDISFSDVPTTHWAHDSIKKMAENGIVNGYPDGKFMPESPVSRGEFCKMLSICGGIVSSVNQSNPTENWAYPYYLAMKENTWNYDEWYLSKFDESTIISRGEVAVGLSDVYLGYPISLVGKMAEVKATLETAYDDAEKIGSFSEVVYIMTINNLMNGYEDRCFHTEKNVTRAEMCAILDRAFFSNNKNYEKQQIVWDKFSSYEYLLSWLKNNGEINGNYISFSVPSGDTLYSLSFNLRADVLAVNRTDKYNGELCFAEIFLEDGFYGVSFNGCELNGYLDISEFTETSPISYVEYIGGSGKKRAFVELSQVLISDLVSWLDWFLYTYEVGISVSDLGFYSF